MNRQLRVGKSKFKGYFLWGTDFKYPVWFETAQECQNYLEEHFQAEIVEWDIK